MFKSVDNQLDVQNFLDLAGLTYFWSKAKNYIDNKFTDTGWKALSPGQNFELYGETQMKYRKVGNRIELSGVLKPKKELKVTSVATAYNLFVLPEEARPRQTRYYVQQGTAMNRWLLSIPADDGLCTISRYGTTNFGNIPETAWLPIDVSYFLN